MADFFVGIILLVIIGGAVFYIVKAKKRGVKCIGCPAAGNCPSQKSGSVGCDCGCQTEINDKK